MDASPFVWDFARHFNAMDRMQFIEPKTFVKNDLSVSTRFLPLRKGIQGKIETSTLTVQGVPHVVE